MMHKKKTAEQIHNLASGARIKRNWKAGSRKEAQTVCHPPLRTLETDRTWEDPVLGSTKPWASPVCGATNK